MHYIFLNRKIHVIIGCAMLCVVFFGSISTSSLPHAELIPNSDKLVHALAYGGLALWFAQLIERKGYARLATGLLCYGALIEMVQGLLPHRSASILDLLANLVGILTALLICSCVVKFSLD